MAGKKKKPGAKTENRGGKRNPVGGRPPKNMGSISDDVKQAWVDAAKRLEEEFGMPIQEAALRLIYDSGTQASVKASILKVYNEATLVKESKSEVTKTEKPLVIGLPRKRQDPAKVIPIDGGKNDRKKSQGK